MYLIPDFTGMTLHEFFIVVMDAMGQLFYSISVAMGIMVAYGSYAKKETNLMKSINQIEFFDTPVRLKEKDIVVLMSDGLYEGTDWRRIEELLAGRGKLQQKAYEIIEAVNTGIQKEKDNASIVLVEGFI